MLFRSVDCEQFVDIKVAGFKSKGRRVAVWPVSAVEEMEPVRKPEPKDDGSGPDSGDDTMNQPQPYENLDPDAGKSEQQVADEITGQLSFNFDD